MDAMILQLVNQAYHRFVQRKLWTFLESEMSFNTVASTATYALTGATSEDVEWGGWLDVRIEAVNRVLEERSIAELLRMDPDLTKTGTVEMFARAGINASQEPMIRLFKVPSSVQAVKVRYRQELPTLLAATELDMPVAAHYIIENMAASLLASRDERPGMAKRYQDMAEEGIADLIVRDDNQSGRRVQIGREGIRRNRSRQRSAYEPFPSGFGYVTKM